jgi:hypothetical protein
VRYVAAGLVLVCTPACAPNHGPTEAVYPFGDPAALALSPFGSRLWSADGAAVTEIALEGTKLIERRRFPVDASMLALACDGERLFVAGGSQGLLVVDLAPAVPGARVIEQRAGMVCTDVELAGGRVLATFGALRGSRLVVCDAATLALVAEASLPEGVAWAVAARDQSAWVALGTGGLVRVDFEDPRAPNVRPGPGPDAFPPPEGFRLGASVVRDVALSSTHLYAAADGAGLAAVALDDDWSPATPVELSPLVLEGAPTYAWRVACDGARVAVGTNLGPVAAMEGAPFAAHGWMNARFEVGGVADGDYRRGKGEGLLLFERGPGGLAPLAAATTRGGWRALVLRDGRSFEQHLGEGLLVRALEDGGVRLVAKRRPEGLAALAVAPALEDSDLLLCGVDPAGSIPPGWLRARNGSLAVDDETRSLPPVGLLVGAQWRDPVHGDAWCLAGVPLGWRLWRIDAARPARSSFWEVVPPLDPDGERGLAYFSSEIDGDVLLLARARSRYGLLGASAAALCTQARAAEPQSKLELVSLFQARTHEGDELRWMFTWAPALLEGEDGRRVAVVPAGFDTSSDPARAGRARWLCFDVTGAAQGRVELIATWFGAEAPGHALRVATIHRAGRNLTYGVDFMGRLDIVDLTRPEKPRRVAWWSVSADALDGKPSNLLDVVLEERGDGTMRAWLAAGRLGVLTLDVSRLGEAPPLLLESRDTPGWATSVELFDGPNGRRLVVGDQKAGVRILAP